MNISKTKDILQITAFWYMTSCSLVDECLKMEEASFYETLEPIYTKP
jgi:hypothetical protein